MLTAYRPRSWGSTGKSFRGRKLRYYGSVAIAMGKADHGIFLDTATLEYKYVPVHLAGYRIVIGNTNKVRRLEDSKYNERRSQCEPALADIRKIYPVQSFGALTVEAF